MRQNRRSATTWIALGALALLVARLDATQDPARGDLEVALAVSRARAHAAERVLASVVTVRTLGGKREEYGSGFVVGREGQVLTALHVVRGAPTILVRLEDGSEYGAELAGQDRYADLALLRVKAPGRAFRAVRIGREERVRLGETVLALGNPFGLGGSVSRGVLSARERRNVMPESTVVLLQTDAPINPGSSGGPLIDLRGEVVGMVTSILSSSGGHQGVGFAVPASELRYALASLLKGEPVDRSWLGVRVREVGGTEPGLLVEWLAEDGPAKRAGLETGDTILRIHNRRIEEIRELRDGLRETNVGAMVRLGIRRGEKLLDIWVLAGAVTDRPSAS